MQPNRTRTKRALHAGKSFPPREKGRFIFPGRHNALPPCAASERHSSLRRGSFNSLTITPTRIRAAPRNTRSEEHTSELQSLMRISYAVFCLKKKKTQYIRNGYRLTFYINIILNIS